MGVRSCAVKPQAAVSRGNRPLAFGVNLLNRGPLARPDILRQLARAADTLGYEVITISDHVVLPTKTSAPYPYAKDGQFPVDASSDYLEPIALVGWLLAATRRVRLGISVLVVPYRNPVVTAKQLATLDVLSGGRVIVGAGVGWWPEEFELLQAPPFAERGAVTDEYLRLMKELWTADRPHFAGRYYRFQDAGALPHPVQKPHPPIWIGGHTERALRRTAELADAWHPIGLRDTIELGPDELAAKVARIRDLARQAGRDPAAIGVALRARLDLWPARDRRTAPALPLTGPSAKVAEDILAYRRAGVDTLVFDLAATEPRGMADTLRRFAREVRPRVTRAARQAARR